MLNLAASVTITTERKLKLRRARRGIRIKNKELERLKLVAAWVSGLMAN